MVFGHRCILGYPTMQNTNFHDAEDFCESNGGTLASVHSDFEHNSMVNLLSTSKYFPFFLFSVKQYYIGFSDEAQEGTMVWSDGSPWDYHRWAPGKR